VVGERVDHESLAIRPAAVDGRLVHARAPRDRLDGQGGVARLAEFGERLGEHRAAHLGTAPARASFRRILYRNFLLRYV
jgi:hypothetical protein